MLDISEEIKNLNELVEENAAPLQKIRKGTLDWDIRAKKIVNLYLKHKTYNEISKELDISYSTIKTVIGNLIKEWQKEDVNRLQAMRWADYNRINLLEAEAWKMWEASIGKPKVVKMQASSKRIPRDSNGNQIGNTPVPTSSRAEITEEERTGGDTYWFDQIKWCIKERRALMGLDSPKKFVEMADTEGAKTKAEFTRDEILGKLEKWRAEALQDNSSPTNYIDAIEDDSVPETHAVALLKE